MTSTNCSGTGGHRSKIIEHTLHLTLEEMYNGTRRQLSVEKNVVCDVCNGSGSASETVEHNSTYENQCHNCSGRKTVRKQTTLMVNVRRGTRRGHRIIFGGDAQNRITLPGDVVVTMEQIAHPIYKRRGDDLMVTLPLDGLVESLCGFKKLVTTLDNRRLSLSAPKGTVVKNNHLMYVPGEGMPKYKNALDKGNLIIRFEMVNMPRTIRSRFVPVVEQCLQRRPQVDIPVDAVECNWINVVLRKKKHPSDPDEYVEEREQYEEEQEQYKQEQEQYEEEQEQYKQEQEQYEEARGQYEDTRGRYDEAHWQYEYENGMEWDEYGSDEQYDQENQYYHENSNYEVQYNNEHAREYDLHYNQHFFNYNNPSYQQYDATQQYRYHN